MAKQGDLSPRVRRSSPGVLNVLFGTTLGIVIGLLLSLLLSIIIEWVGLAWFWQEEGVNHAKSVLVADQALLNTQLVKQSSRIKQELITKTTLATDWIAKQIGPDTSLNSILNTSSNKRRGLGSYIHRFMHRYYPYIEVINYVTQTFIIRLILIIFSLPVFLIAWWVGFVDGLVERELRRWGGGRESSNVFNLARRSVMPTFYTACVIYLSLPFSINPSIVILPFALMLCLTMRITMARLKKYF